MRKGHTVKINQADGTTLIHHFKAALWDKQIEADLEADLLDVLLAEAEKEHATGLSQPM